MAGTMTFADLYGGGKNTDVNPASEPSSAAATGAPKNAADNAPGMTFAGLVIALAILRILWERGGK